MYNDRNKRTMMMYGMELFSHVLRTTIHSIYWAFCTPLPRQVDARADCHSCKRLTFCEDKMSLAVSRTVPRTLSRESRLAARATDAPRCLNKRFKVTKSDCVVVKSC